MKLIVFDCDSTLSAIEGIDELARVRGPETFTEAVSLTNAAMNGEVPIDEIFARRLDIIQPDQTICKNVGQLYIDHVEPTAVATLDKLRAAGWHIVIVSGGFTQVIAPLAAYLGITRIEAVPLKFHPDGSYAGFDTSAPPTRNGGKPEIIAQLKTELKPSRIVMVGDGVSDLEAQSGHGRDEAEHQDRVTRQGRQRERHTAGKRDACEHLVFEERGEEMR